MDPAFVDRVRQASDIVEVVGEYVRLEKRGKDFWGLCPFHSEKSPSFSVAPDKQFFHCFGCQVNGSVFDFIQRRENIAFPQAVELLAKRARIPVPQVERTPEEEAAYREREQLYGALDLAARYFEHMLQEPAGQAAREYLSRRGLTVETQRRFRLGYAPQGWDGLLRSLRGRFAEAVLFRVGLLSRREGSEGFYDRFRDRIMFPITDMRSRVIGFGGRIMSGEKEVAKYLNTPESPLFNKRRILYALHLARDAMRSNDQAIIVEGYMDAISAHQAEVTNVVASLGTALTAEQAKGLREQCSQVVIAYDADTAGQNATLRGLDLLVTAGCDVKVLRLPQGKDPDELIRTQGPEAFLAAVKAAVPLLEFKLRLAIDRHANAGNEAERQSRVIKDVLPILATASSEVQRDQYVALVTRALTRSAPEEAMIRNAVLVDLRRHERASARSHKGSRIVENISDVGAAEAAIARIDATDPVYRAETFLLQIVLHHPHLWARVQAGLGEQPFTTPVYQRAAAAIDPSNAESAAVSTMLERLDDPALRTLVAKLALAPAITVDPERDVADCITNIRKHRIQRRIDELQKLIVQRSAAGQDYSDLWPEFTKLQGEIKRNIK